MPSALTSPTPPSPRPAPHQSAPEPRLRDEARWCDARRRVGALLDNLLTVGGPQSDPNSPWTFERSARRRALQDRNSDRLGGLGYPRSVDLQAVGRMAAEGRKDLGCGRRSADPWVDGRPDHRQEQTSHRDHRRVQRLVALLAAGLLLAACSGDGRSTVSPPVAPDGTATTHGEDRPTGLQRCRRPPHPGQRRRRPRPPTGWLPSSPRPRPPSATRPPPPGSSPPWAAPSSGPTAPWSATRGWSPRSWPSSRPRCAGR